MHPPRDERLDELSSGLLVLLPCESAMRRPACAINTFTSKCHLQHDLGEWNPRHTDLHGDSPLLLLPLLPLLLLLLV
jgi:hypothetical protein